MLKLTGILLLAAMPLSALSAQSASDIARGIQRAGRVVAPAPPLRTLQRSCVLRGAGSAIIGEKGSDAIIGEKGGDAIIGEKGGDAIIGEKGSDAIIGEKGMRDNSGAQVLGNSWNASGFTTFKHVISGPPGPVNLVLNACTDASGGETVATYLADANGVRKTGWRLFVIATKQGNSRSGTLIVPRAAAGKPASLAILVVVENAAGRPHKGEYQLTVSR